MPRSSPAEQHDSNVACVSALERCTTLTTPAIGYRLAARIASAVDGWHDHIADHPLAGATGADVLGGVDRRGHDHHQV
jgi:hypothetical protein